MLGRAGTATFVALIVIALAGPVVAADPPRVSVPADATDLGDTIGFRGTGYGHGVGLSQYGARGRALAGQATGTILRHYYQGTTVTTIDPATPIRILVLNAYQPTDAAPLVAVGLDGPWTIEGFPNPFAADTRLSVRPPLAGTSEWRLTVTDPAGGTIATGTRSGPFLLAPADTSGHLELKTKPSYYDEYRGVLRVHPISNRLTVVNEVGLDAYLRGVVPVEMPATWPFAALRAQAIAARSYAEYRLRPGVGIYDTVDDSRSQVYRGLLAEKAATDEAISTSAGKVLRSGGSRVNALFHSTGGAATEHNENAFVSPVGKKVAAPLPYLRGTPDLDANGVPFDAAAPYATWTTSTYPLATLSAWISADERTNVGDLVALDLQERGVSGRLIRIALVGSLGTKTVSGDVFRSVFNSHRPAADPILRSNAFYLLP